MLTSATFPAKCLCIVATGTGRVSDVSVGSMCPVIATVRL